MFAMMFAVQSGSETLTVREILENVPLDPASVFVYLLLCGAVLWVIWGSRSKGNPVA